MQPFLEFTYFYNRFIFTASVKINKFKKRRILLAVIWNYITTHGQMNIKFLIQNYSNAAIRTPFTAMF